MALVVDPHGAEPELLRKLLDVRGSRVLEIGCGDGRLTRAYCDEAASVVAVDPDADAIALARGGRFSRHVRFRELDATELDFARSSFDLVFFSWSL